ncbi:MAG: imidazole glycerol phosphate synthase subunit HisH [Betaproteobacteria bacterium]|nr:imidazole glycerol phosphate synthase subunit HisH [Betaproteobacteria bacterium]
MPAPEVIVVDYGMGNLLSVSRGLEHCGAAVTVSSDPNAIRTGERVVLPGVGAFADGMAELNRFGLGVAVREVAQRGAPLLGICLGMQMLLDESDEFGRTAGLRLIEGRVVAIPATTAAGTPQKTPHIGWNALRYGAGRASWQGTLLEDTSPGDAVYFVHSFMASPNDPTHRVADCIYGERPISAVVARENVHGCQFHPEKSGEVGLKILRRFLTL